jgi:hypothetical protein
MSDPVSPVLLSNPPTADRRDEGAQPAAPVRGAAPAPQPKTDDEPLRLVIEPSNGAGGYTYKLYDRVTGLLMIELPREDADSMSTSPDYSAGQVYSAKA